MRWKLRKAVTVVNQVLASLCLDKHPGKTFIGRIEKGFEFLGYAFSPAGLGAATKTVDNFVARACQLYEHKRERPAGCSPLGAYVQRWLRWVWAGIHLEGTRCPARPASTLAPSPALADLVDVCRSVALLLPGEALQTSDRLLTGRARTEELEQRARPTNGRAGRAN